MDLSQKSPVTRVPLLVRMIRPFYKVWRFVSELRHNRILLKYKWHFSPRYWRLIQYYSTAKFWSTKIVFDTKNRYRSSTDTLNLGTEILRLILPSVTFAVLIVVSLALLEKILISNISFYFIGLWEKPWAKILLAKIAEIRADTQTYSSICNSMAQIAGIFLGLYFTAVCVVASTVYSRVSGKIRMLFLSEETGNFYIRIAALLGGIAIILLGAIWLDFNPGILNLCFLIALGVFSVFGFVKLGIRILHFFDPQYLVGYLNQDLFRTLLGALKGCGSTNPSFQKYYQQKAEDILTTYRDVVLEACSRHNYQPSEFATLLSRPLTWLRLYIKEKHKIPTQSMWFKRIGEHQDWLISNYSQLSVALQTSTQLQPKVEPDLIWFEKQVQKILVEIIKKIKDENKAQIIVEFLTRSQSVFTEFGYQIEIQGGIDFLHSLQGCISELTQKRTAEMQYEKSALEPEKITFNLAIYDLLGLCLISMVLGLSRRFENLNVKSFADSIISIKWNKNKSIYEPSFPREVTKQLEFIMKGVNFEHRVEGNFISPLWYRQQLTALSLLRHIKERIKSLVFELESNFEQEANKLIEKKLYISAVQVIERGLEAYEKYRYHFAILQKNIGGFEDLRRVVDIPWPQIDWEQINRESLSIREKIIVTYSKLLPYLATLPKSKELPDFFGHAYTVIADECYNAMASDNEKLFAQLFPLLFVVFPLAQQRLKEKLKDYPAEKAINFISEPLLDILELSGFAKIYSELDDLSFWQTVKNVWDKYFETIPNKKQLCQHIYATISYRHSQFALFSGDVKRTSWKQDTMHQLRKRGIVDDSFYYFSGGKSQEKRHSSPLIRVISRNDLFMDNPIDIFLAIYVRNRIEAKDLELPQRAGSFSDMLAREESKDSES